MTTMQEAIENAGDHFSKKKVLVTGGLGFIAGVVASRLRGRKVGEHTARPFRV